MSMLLSKRLFFLFFSKSICLGEGEMLYSREGNQINGLTDNSHKGKGNYLGLKWDD